MCFSGYSRATNQRRNGTGERLDFQYSHMRGSAGVHYTSPKNLQCDSCIRDNDQRSLLPLLYCVRFRRSDGTAYC